MSDTRGQLIVAGDAVLKGEVSNAKRVEVHGYVEGDIKSDELYIAENGKLYGQIKANSAEVDGTVQGEVRVQNLIAIKKTGDVSGNVKYGRLSMEEGAELTAHVRNVPPTITGDLDLSVARSGSVRITRADLSAEDPDDAAKDLTFTVSNVHGGSVRLSGSPGAAATSFTQQQLVDGEVSFAHDGSQGGVAGFDCVVADSDGATSGAPKTIKVAVR